MKNIGFFMHNRGRYFVQQLKAGAGADTDAPSIPANLAASSITATTLTLTWDPSTDNVGVVSYEVEQAVGAGAFAWLATVAHPTVTLAVSGLDPAGVYRFRVRAIDAAGNMSGWGPSDAGLTVDMFTFVAPAFDGEVFVFTPDGQGGGWAGGAFLNVTDANGTHARARICHIDRNGLVTSWDPGSDQRVIDIAIIDSDYIAVAKQFNAVLSDNTLGGFDCRGFGAVHRTTGIAMSWDPGVIQTVTGLAVDSGRIFLTALGSSASVRSHTVATQTLDAWNPTVNVPSYGITVDGSDVLVTYAGGALVGGLSIGRNKVARTSKTVSAGGVATFTAMLNNGAEGCSVSLIGDGKMLIAAYNITLSGTQAIRGMAKVDKDTGVADAWTLDANAANDCERHAAGFDRIVWHRGGQPVRIFNLTTGVQVDSITVTGMATYATFSYGRKFWFPRANRAVVFGNMTALGSRVVSGTSRMFVIDVP
jgi:hypothetical protein